MPASSIVPVILCGGSGTRLWPLSRKSFPKQFVPLIGDKSLLQLTGERLTRLEPSLLLVVAFEEHRFLVAEALVGAQAPVQVILEPVARNTAAAMALAALHVSDRGTQLLFCPADHHIPDGEAFAASVRNGIPAADAGAIVTFGIAPAFPSTAYGYIERGAARPDGTHSVKRFIEKPDASQSEQLLLQGGVFWNAGIFLCKAQVLLDALEQHAPDILAQCRLAMCGARAEVAPTGQKFVRPEPGAFAACRSQSIDYAVLEKHADIALAPFDGQWSDVGSWNAVGALTPADANGNRIQGIGTAHLSENTFIHSPHRQVVALGVKDLVVIDTPDAVLVAHATAAEQVKDVVALLEQAQRTEAVMHRKVARPWGWYDSIDVGARFQVKRIGVKPGAALSLQMHHHRAEHWVVVKGTAEVTRGGQTYLLSENESTYIPIGETHRLRNPGKVELEVIEVQSGAYLGEDDIVRMEDQDGRGE